MSISIGNKICNFFFPSCKESVKAVNKELDSAFSGLDKRIDSLSNKDVSEFYKSVGSIVYSYANFTYRALNYNVSGFAPSAKELETIKKFSRLFVGTIANLALAAKNQTSIYDGIDIESGVFKKNLSEMYNNNEKVVDATKKLITFALLASANSKMKNGDKIKLCGMISSYYFGICSNNSILTDKAVDQLYSFLMVRDQLSYSYLGLDAEDLESPEIKLNKQYKKELDEMKATLDDDFYSITKNVARSVKCAKISGKRFINNVVQKIIFVGVFLGLLVALPFILMSIPLLFAAEGIIAGLAIAFVCQWYFKSKEKDCLKWHYGKEAIPNIEKDLTNNVKLGDADKFVTMPPLDGQNIIIKNPSSFVDDIKESNEKIKDEIVGLKIQ